MNYMNSATITIPKQLTQKGELVIVPRKEYEELLVFRQMKEFISTPAQKRALVSAERNFLAGKTLSYHELTKKLGITH